MNVLLSAYACDPSAGGEFNNGWRYACNVSDDRAIWCISTSEGRAAIEQLLVNKPLHGLKMIYIDTPKWLLRWKNRSPILGVYFHYFWWQYLAYKKAKRLIKDIPFDVVHHATWSSLQLGTLMWKLKRPMLFGPVGGGQKSSSKYKNYFYGYWKFEVARDIISFLLLNVVRSASRTLMHADLVLVNNEDTYSLAKTYGARNIDFAPCTMLADEFLPSTRPQKKQENILRILWVGRILPRKGLRLILEAFAKVDRSLPIELTIVGYGLLDNLLPGWLEELRIKDRVHYLGRLSMDQLKSVYASHDAFIYCSLRESLAAQFFEAMAYGMPLVVFDLHGAKTFIPDDVAIKVPFGDPADTILGIASAIEKMYHSPAERLKKGERAYELTKSFTWSSRIKIINEYYERLVASALIKD